MPGGWRGPKLVAASAVYLDRPFWQMHHEAPRWFGHRLPATAPGYWPCRRSRLFVPGMVFRTHPRVEATEIIGPVVPRR